MSDASNWQFEEREEEISRLEKEQRCLRCMHKLTEEEIGNDFCFDCYLEDRSPD